MEVCTRIIRPHSRLLENRYGPHAASLSSFDTTNGQQRNSYVEKSSFLAEKFDCLGHVIRPGCLEIVYITTSAIKELRYSPSQTELRSFFGFCNVFRRFVPNFSHITAPLNKELRKYQLVQYKTFTETEKNAVAPLKPLPMILQYSLFREQKTSALPRLTHATLDWEANYYKTIKTE